MAAQELYMYFMSFSELNWVYMESWTDSRTVIGLHIVLKSPCVSLCDVSQLVLQEPSVAQVAANHLVLVVDGAQKTVRHRLVERSLTSQGHLVATDNRSGFNGQSNLILWGILRGN